VALLHVTNGESPAGTLRQTGIGGEVLSWRDVLHEGPAPAPPDPRLDEAFRGGDDVVLWFEHDLYDQLQLIDLLALARAEGAAVELIVIGEFPGRPSFAGLGELTVDELETLWPTRQPASPGVLEAATGALAAYRASDPTQLAGWAARDAPELPYLGPALRRLLEELPAPGDGLSRTERRALEAIAEGETTPGAAFVAAQRLEDAPFLGDTWFFRTLSELGEGDGRLIESPPLALTSNGERVLRGDADRVELLGIDRWIGGTHVTPGNGWRWDGELVRP